ncbi:MAG TPA: biotin/lipoyl-binding protein, partial [Chroococcales cyanobacterium]
MTIESTRNQRPIKTLSQTAASLALIALALAGCNNNATEEKTTTKTEESAPAQQQAQVCPVVPVEAHKLDVELDLPGNLEAYQDVPLHAKVEGFVSWIGVDRGSHVKKGQALMRITAPEVDAKVKEAYAKVSATEAAVDQA